MREAADGGGPSDIHHRGSAAPLRERPLFWVYDPKNFHSLWSRLLIYSVVFSGGRDGRNDKDQKTAESFFYKKSSGGRRWSSTSGKRYYYTFKGR